jgi:two-component system, OmpR family, response regulator
MLAQTIALIDDDQDYTEFLAQYLRQQGAKVDVFHDSNDLLVADHPYDYEFYVVDLMLPGVNGVKLIQMLRRRTNAGILVVSGRLDPGVFKEVIEASADMYLAKPVQFEQVALAITAVQRRASGAAAHPASPVWKLDRRASQLLAPGDTVIDLSPTDLAVLECFVEADGGVVSRDTLRQHLGRDHPAEAGGDGLNAAIFRLRRRIERVTPAVVPLQSRSRVGYIFRAPLRAI